MPLHPTLKRRLLVLLGVGISVVCLWFALQGTDFREIGRNLARARFWYAIPVLGAYLFNFWIKAYRWRILLRPMRETTARSIFPPMMIGFMGNNILPAHLGEFVRMYLGARQLELGKSQVLATIILERMFDFLSVVFFLGLVLLTGENLPDLLVISGYYIAGFGLLFMALAACYVKWTSRFLSVLKRCLFFVPEGFRTRVLSQLEVAALGLHAIKKPGLLIQVILTSIFQWGLVGLSAYASLLAVGLTPPVSAGFVVLAATTVGVTLPTAPGFFGTMQYAFKVALIPFGIAAGDAVAASVFFHVLSYVSVTLIGLYFLRRTGQKLGQLQRQAESF